VNIPLSMALLCVDCDCISVISKELGSAYCGHCGSQAVLKLDKYMPTMSSVIITSESALAVNGLEPTANSGLKTTSKPTGLIYIVGPSLPLTLRHTWRYITVVARLTLRTVKRRTNLWHEARVRQ